GPENRHAKARYVASEAMPVEFRVVADGHRPVNERFRVHADTMIQDEVDALGIPTLTAGGTVAERLRIITAHFDLPRVIPLDEALRRAEADYAAIDTRSELEREPVGV